METVLVTGVTGRIGANLALQLLKRGLSVRGMVQPEDPGRRKLDQLPDVEVRMAALHDADAIADAVEGVDSIVHLAAQMVLGSTPVDRYFDTNTLGTLRVLEAAAQARHQVRRVVFASTDGTYGPARPLYQPMDEAHPQQPGDYYGISKVLAERLVANYGQQYDLDWTIVRYGSVIAPDEVLGLFRYRFVSGFLHKAEEGRRGNLWPLFESMARPWEVLEAAVGEAAVRNPAVAVRSPTGPWALHLTDVRDAVEGTIVALEHPAASGESFNIVGPCTVDFDAGATLIADALDLPRFSIELPAMLAFAIDRTKAERVLAFRPTWPLERMVKTALERPDATTSDTIDARLVSK